MFSAIENSSTRPRRWRSSGMCPSPASKHARAASSRVTSSPPSDDAPGSSSLRSPVSASISSVCPLPSTPAIADDLAGAHLERDAAHLLDPAVVDDAQVLDLEQRLAGLRRRLLDRGAAPRGRPSAARAPPRSPPRAASVSIILPRRSTVIRSAISSTSFSLWLMKMIDLPCVGEAADDLEELLRLLRRQHGGRLVEDEDVGARGRAPSGSRRAAAGRR